MIAIFANGMGCGNNSTSNEEFPVKALEDQQKSPCCIYYMISKVIFLGLCVKMKYSYQK